ncbi:MAG: hypothetical protein RLZZ210_1658 [Pseudomonadota bacterium]|jgi:hypothetical protein
MTLSVLIKFGYFISIQSTKDIFENINFEIIVC